VVNQEVSLQELEGHARIQHHFEIQTLVSRTKTSYRQRRPQALTPAGAQTANGSQHSGHVFAERPRGLPVFVHRSEQARVHRCLHGGQQQEKGSGMNAFGARMTAAATPPRMALFALGHLDPLNLWSARRTVSSCWRRDCRAFSSSTRALLDRTALSSQLSPRKQEA